MTVECIKCKHFNLKGSELGRLGFGLCALRSISKATTYSATWGRQCAQFTPATPETIAKREAVLA